jgi:uncharacterized LabA/DUF88 family protein
MSEDESLKRIIREEIKEILPEIVRSVMEEERSSNRKFAVLIDFENFRKGIDHPEEVLDFSWLTFDIHEVAGKVVIGVVFFPAYLERDVNLGTIIDIQGYLPVRCLRGITQTRGTRTTIKQIDTVDNIMLAFGRFILENTDVTDIVIVSGDYDFQVLVSEIKNRGRKVHIYSAGRALSGGFRLQERSGVSVSVIDQFRCEP